MKKPIALVTDSASNLSPELAEKLGVRVVAGSFAFADVRMPDTLESAGTVYERMAGGSGAPRVFGPTEQAWSEAFRAGLESAEAVLCLVTPFDVSSAFTTASAAMLAIQFDEPEARIKIVNPGVGSAGLASLLVTLASMDLRGIEAALDAVEELEPRCDTVLAPADVCWLEATGKLGMIEERLGALESGLPVVRAGTRITGVSVAPREQVADALADAVLLRVDMGAAVNVTVVHANAPERAAEVEAAIRERAQVASLATVPQAATLTAQLGPGAVGIGVAPANCGAKE